MNSVTKKRSYIKVARFVGTPIGRKFDMEFSYKTFEDEFVSSMAELEQAFRAKDHLKTISYLRFLAKSYYVLNCKFKDDRLEEITREISLDLLGETKIANNKDETVAFYDGFGLAERGLADIYVSALVKLGYRVTWIMHFNAPNLETLQKRYMSNENVFFRIIPKSPILERMQHLQRIIQEIAPHHLFFYSSPWDICGIGSISTVTGDVTRYLIDLTDHAFWLGKCSADYFIGFRNWSYNVEKQLRGISSEQLIILPYYPYSRTQYPYEGMPFDTEKYEFIFSGGGPYKIEGDSSYQEMVEYILTNHPEIKFVFAGNGTNPILKYLKETYPDQFFKINERKDLDEVLKHAKLYLGTYPIGGALMTQYAIENKCIPLCLALNPNSIGGDPKTFLLKPDKAHFVFYKKEELLSEVDKLLIDNEHYNKMHANLSGQVISEKEFTEELQRVLTEHQTKFKKQDMPVNLDRFLAVYKQRADYKIFCELIRDSHNDWIKRKYLEIIEKMEAKNWDGTM